MTSCTLKHKLKKRSIHLDFSGEDVSCIGGVELMRAADDRLELCKAASKLMYDPRDQSSVTHQWDSLVRQRIFAIAAGFGDLNDHQQLRLDTALQSAVGVLEPMGSASTRCRMEAAIAQHATAQAGNTVFEMHRLILERFIASFDEPPSSLILDFDGTDDRVHGEQQGRAFNTHYDGYRFLPLYVYCGEKLLVSYLRPINRPDTTHSAAVLSLLVKGIRAHWSQVGIVFRGDGGFYRPLLLSWCERHDVRYIVGYTTNSVLMSECQVSRETLSSCWLWLDHQDVNISALKVFKVFKDIDYQAGNWVRPVESLPKWNITR